MTREVPARKVEKGKSLGHGAMSTQAPILERRRGERVLIRVPVEVRVAGDGGKEEVEHSETSVVSRYGALIHLRVPPKLGATVIIINKFSQQSEQFRIAWISDEPREFGHEVGIEILAPNDSFWGIEFPSKERKS